MTNEQLEAYLVLFRIEEITQCLRNYTILPNANKNRSPSPAPKYDPTGRRINTRERRHRQRLEEERQGLVEITIRTIPRYRPSRSYTSRRHLMIEEKIYIPVVDYPGINFIGQLLGPRGSSLEAMSAQSGATISIRGRGSVKEGKERSGQNNADDQQEPLQCRIIAYEQHKVDKAKELINSVIETAALSMDHENEHKRRQLRELAVINGTFRDDEKLGVQNELNSIAHGFITRPVERNTDKQLKMPVANADEKREVDLDQEYHLFMEEIASTSASSVINQPHPARCVIPPWRRDRASRRSRSDQSTSSSG